MKYPILPVFLLIALSVQGQSVLNGDFELNSATSCMFNQSNAEYNDLMEYSVGFGPNTELDLQTHSCGYASPPSNDWFVSLSKRPSGDYDAFSLELSEPLVSGLTYQLSYWEYATDTFGNVNVPLYIGLSEAPNDFGELLHSSLPPLNTWEQRNFTFTAPNNGGFLTVKIDNEGSSKAWNFVDNFMLTALSPTKEESLVGEMAVYPNPTSGSFFVKIPLGGKIVNLFNAAGQLEQSHKVNGLQQLEMEAMASGVYWVQILTEMESIARKLVVE